ncbi:PREDICTED: uncharacterized protein LOC107348789 [Acropora digitifera]|uniref:uncharacterized protein LOC107348789 n=1 Tax=Acropora digitifera TaxID=70779 RepID=UPI00077A836F|nr:PREDICTED: uncharacterized protein LOC107348789 [Acropora digitifera]
MCMKRGHRARECKAFDVLCSECGKSGHQVSLCDVRIVQSVPLVAEFQFSPYGQNKTSTTISPSSLHVGTGDAKPTPTQLFKGELLEALPENKQPSDRTKTALVGRISRKIRVECGMEEVMKVTGEEADLLLAISSLTLSKIQALEHLMEHF